MISTSRSVPRASVARRTSLLNAAARVVRTVVALICLTLCAWLAGTPRAEAQTEIVEYYATDALGSIRVVFDPSGTVKARSDYLPFGEEWQPTGNLPKQRFTGQERDTEEGIDYFEARRYQTRTGRFNATDPVFAGLFRPQLWNRYAYAANNPLLFVDPDGRNPFALDMTTICTLVPCFGFSDQAEAKAAGEGVQGGSFDHLFPIWDPVSGTAPLASIDVLFAGSAETKWIPIQDERPKPPPPNPRTDIITIAAPTTAAIGEGTVNGLVDFSGGVAIGKLLNYVGKYLFRGAIGPSSAVSAISSANPAKGSALPRNLREQLAVEQVRSLPGAGRELPITMTDPRWPASEGWVKMEQILDPGGRSINVHYLVNRVTGATADFKIIIR